MSGSLCFNKLCPSRSRCYRARPRPTGRRYTVGSYTVAEGSITCDGFIDTGREDGRSTETKTNTESV